MGLQQDPGSNKAHRQVSPLSPSLSRCCPAANRQRYCLCQLLRNLCAERFGVTLHVFADTATRVPPVYLSKVPSG